MALGLARLPAERDRLTLARALGVSEKRLLGWEPSERHEHFDAAGNPTGWTVVTRESEWDPIERARLLALELHDREVCACGFHESVIDDDLAVVPQAKICPVCAGVAQYGRKLKVDNEAADKALGSDAPPTAPRAADGQRIAIHQLTPEEAAAHRERMASLEAARTPRRRRATS